MVSLSVWFLEGGGAGDFSIQGATDGNSNFKIQGATDGHSNFQIQGPTDGGSATYNVQGPIDRYGQSTIQQAYNANQINGKALQYDDPSGIVIYFTSLVILSPNISSNWLDIELCIKRLQGELEVIRSSSTTASSTGTAVHGASRSADLASHVTTASASGASATATATATATAATIGTTAELQALL